MAILKNDDIQLLCKAENALDMCFTLLRRESIPFVVNDLDTGEEVAEVFTREDYWRLVNFIEGAFEDKVKLNKKVAQYHKDNPEKHRKYNREWARKKQGK